MKIFLVIVTKISLVDSWASCLTQRRRLLLRGARSYAGADDEAGSKTRSSWWRPTSSDVCGRWLRAGGGGLRWWERWVNWAGTCPSHLLPRDLAVAARQNEVSRLDWVQKCMECEVEGPRPRGRPKRTWREVVEKDCQARKLNTEDAVDRSKWRKLIKDVW